MDEDIVVECSQSRAVVIKQTTADLIPFFKFLLSSQLQESVSKIVYMEDVNADLLEDIVLAVEGKEMLAACSSSSDPLLDSSDSESAYNELISLAKYLNVDDHPYFTMGIARQRYALKCLLPDIHQATVEDFEVMRYSAQVGNVPIPPFSTLKVIATPVVEPDSYCAIPEEMPIFLKGKVRVVKQAETKTRCENYVNAIPVVKHLLRECGNNIVVAGGFVNTHCFLDGCDLASVTEDFPFESDIDIFFFGLKNAREADRKFLQVLDVLQKYSRDSYAAASSSFIPPTYVDHTGNAINVSVLLAHMSTMNHHRHDHNPIVFQIVKRLYRTPDELIRTFDTQSAQVCLRYDASTDSLVTYGSASFLQSLKYNAIWIDPRKQSGSYLPRLLKYFGRGANILLPGLERKEFQCEECLFRKEVDSHDWIDYAASLLRLEAHIMEAVRMSHIRRSLEDLTGVYPGSLRYYSESQWMRLPNVLRFPRCSSAMVKALGETLLKMDHAQAVFHIHFSDLEAYALNVLTDRSDYDIRSILLHGHVEKGNLDRAILTNTRHYTDRSRKIHSLCIKFGETLISAFSSAPAETNNLIFAERDFRVHISRQVDFGDLTIGSEIEEGLSQEEIERREIARENLEADVETCMDASWVADNYTRTCLLSSLIKSRGGLQSSIGQSIQDDRLHAPFLRIFNPVESKHTRLAWERAVCIDGLSTIASLSIERLLEKIRRQSFPSSQADFLKRKEEIIRIIRIHGCFNPTAEPFFQHCSHLSEPPVPQEFEEQFLESEFGILDVAEEQ